MLKIRPQPVAEALVGKMFGRTVGKRGKGFVETTKDDVLFT